MTEIILRAAQGIGTVDRAIQDTFRLTYKILLSDEELLQFSNYLVATHPEYPAWSAKKMLQDHSKLNEAGNACWVFVLLKPEPYHQAYQEFRASQAAGK